MTKLKPILFSIFLIFLFDNCNNNFEKTSYSFFVAGHVYGSPGRKELGVHPPFKQKFELLKKDSLISFGIFTGDIVKEPSVSSWEAIDEDIEYLNKKVYFAAGNHDLRDSTLFESRYGARYYEFEHKNDLFIILDPNIDYWNITGKQLKFLKEALKKGKQLDNIFIFFHQVLWWAPNTKYAELRLNSHEGKREPLNFWSEIMPLLKKIKKPVYLFAGDIGAANWSSNYMYAKEKNVHFIASGMGQGDGDNFVLVDVSEKGVQIKIVHLPDGKIELFEEDDFIID